MQTIKSGSEISHIFNRGTRYGLRGISVIALKRAEQHDQSGRVAFIAGKKQGNAVWRNRAKRRMRASFLNMSENIVDYDVLLVASRSIDALSYEELNGNMRKCLIKLGVVDDRAL